MTDAEISRRLALAIGWSNVAIHQPTESVWVFSKTAGPETFDYRDPAVIWPIAERFNCFPERFAGLWYAGILLESDEKADTAAKAVALSVIKAKEQK